MLILLSKEHQVLTTSQNEEKSHILTRPRQNYFINFSKVHQDYHEEVSKRQGESDRTTTIRNYLKSKKYFIVFGSRRMDKCPSGYAFNYSMMQRLGILSLDDINDTQIDIEMPDDLKF
jgi:hypothetical protein